MWGDRMHFRFLKNFKRRNYQQLTTQAADCLSSCMICFGVALSLLAVSAQRSNAAGNFQFYGAYPNIPSDANFDISKPSEGRSKFIASAEPAQGGARLIVDLHNGKRNEPVSLWLQVAINDGNGKLIPVTLMQLSDRVKDNPSNYGSRREFNLNYDELNRSLRKILPAAAQHLEIGPGTPLFVYGKWVDYSHDWGGIGRGGIFYMPEISPEESTSGATTRVAQTSSLGARPTELDLAYPITNLMALKYNTVRGGKTVGLKVGGQIGSRLESEGKFQINVIDRLATSTADPNVVLQKLFTLSKNPAEARRVLGPDWTIKPELRYMKKDASGKMLLDEHRLPQPDPMIDVYYDDKDYRASQNDIAIRYRKTEGNGYGSWNLKPGVYTVSAEGIMNRLEYAIDATDALPETIKPFADSYDPLNPFNIVLRQAIPEAVPSEFLFSAVRIVDYRYKFKLQHSSGVEVELSVDNVTAESTRDNRAPIRYVQLEADVAHPATAKANVAKAVDAFFGLSSQNDRFTIARLGANAYIDGRPSMHSIADLEASSPVMQKNSEHLNIAAIAIKSLREELIGKNWLRGPQKNALAAYLLGLVNEREASPSVKKLLTDVSRAKSKTNFVDWLNRQPGWATENLSRSAKMMACRYLFAN